MPAVTQLIPNFLGGVSRQNDDKKLEGQLTECINGYPDPTYGLLKRPGMSYTNQLKKQNGDVFTESELANANWFFIERDAEGSYVGAVVGSNIYVWTADDGTWCTVTNNASSYLSGNNYHFRSIQDTTIITNRGTTAAMQTAPSFTADAVATVRLVELGAYKYSITLQGVLMQVETQGTTTFDDMLVYNSGSTNSNHHLIDKIVAEIGNQHTAGNAAFAGAWYLEAYINSLVIKYYSGVANSINTTYGAVTGTPAGTPTTFTISAKGGATNIGLEAFQDEVINVSKLPVESYDGHVVRILNSDSEADDYYVKFVAADGVKGSGSWQETVSPSVSPGLDASTMPHRLTNTGATTFTFEQVPWVARTAGDNVTNPTPSFIGETINSTFFYNNRFGVLSQDNIIFGVANDAYNFFAKSALTQIDSDPIDLNVSSVRPVVLSEVLPSPQGLTIFSARQQFQVFSPNASTITPSSAVVRSLSNYEMETSIAPADIGTSAIFLSKVPGYSKVFSLELQDIETNPVVVDISKPVLEWIPQDIDDLTVSSQNSVVMLVDRDTSYLYLFRYYNSGEKNLFQAWTKWLLPGTLETAKIINDSLYIISQHEDEYTLGKIVLDEIPTGDVVATAAGFTGNPSLDMATRPVSPDPGTVDAVVYDETNDITKIYVPYTPIQDKEAIMLLTVPTADDNTSAEIDADAGYWATGIERTEIGTGYRYFEVKGNFTGYTDGIVVGYGYDLEAVLPKFYFRRNETTTDFTAPVTVARAKFSVGRTGAVTFKLKATGSNEWKDVQHTADADTYAADSNPVKSERQFTVPIHQRNTNFELKVTSNLPYPVSLVSMMWEGNYSPRFYRRA
jgi:hypothetical protein